jgi:hypothetical protein
MVEKIPWKHFSTSRSLFFGISDRIRLVLLVTMEFLNCILRKAEATSCCIAESETEGKRYNVRCVT